MENIESSIYKSLDPAQREVVTLKAGIHKNGKPIDLNCQRCGACCMSFSIETLGKKAGEKCEYLQIYNGFVRCSIYSQRPEACRRYDCILEVFRRTDRRIIELYAARQSIALHQDNLPNNPII